MIGIENRHVSRPAAMDEDLVIEIEDETLEALTRIAERLGYSVEDYARMLIIASVTDEPVSSASNGSK
jgi:hypothetical protein